METSDRTEAAAPPTVHGQFAWYDLMTRDTERAKRFYGAVVGWPTEPFAGEGFTYDMWVGPRGPLGGIMQMPPDLPATTPPHWLAYIAVRSVDAACDEVRRLGGTVMRPGEDIPNVGRFAIVADPTGAVFALYTSQSDGDVQPAAVPGEFSWHELVTPDPERARAFYAALFGWRDTGSFDLGEAGTYTMFELGPRTRGGIYRRELEPPERAHWLFYIRVPDLAQAVGRAISAGGTLEFGPMDVPGGDQVAGFVDSQGAAFALHQVKGG